VNALRLPKALPVPEPTSQLSVQLPSPSRVAPTTHEIANPQFPVDFSPVLPVISLLPGDSP
jgi:hypothetical protein